MGPVQRGVRVLRTDGQHTGTMGPVTAAGPLAERFTGVHHNTDVFDVVTELFGN